MINNNIRMEHIRTVARYLAGDETADLRHDDSNSDGADVGGLASHVGSGDHLESGLVCQEGTRRR